MRMCPVCGKREIGPRAAMCYLCGAKENREYYLAKGICPICKKNKLAEERKLCVDCLEKDRRRKNASK